MKVRELPEPDKPREKLFRLGPSALTLPELIAVILGTGVQKTDVLELSSAVAKEYGWDLERLCVSSAKEFCTIQGIGKAKAAALSASLELGRRMAYNETAEGKSANSLEQSLAGWCEALKYERREFFVAIFMDRNRQVIDEDRISYGGPDGAYIDSTHLLKRSVRLGASVVAVLHNHPDGSLEASRDDMKVTDFLCRQFRILDIQFLGHFITANGYLKEVAKKVSF